ncbi:TPA: hypothetical protein ACOX9D_004740 [Escherichia coli]
MGGGMTLHSQLRIFDIYIIRRNITIQNQAAVGCFLVKAVADAGIAADRTGS